MAEPNRPGLLAAVRRFVANAAALGEVRLGLLANDLQTEKLRVLDSLSGLLLAIVAGATGLALFSAGLLMLLQPQHRGWAMLLLGLLYLGGAVFSLNWARRSLLGKHRPFEASMAELRRDKAALMGLAEPTQASAANRNTRTASAAATADMDASATRSQADRQTKSQAASQTPWPKAAPTAEQAAHASAELSAAVAALRGATAHAEAAKAPQAQASTTSRPD